METDPGGLNPASVPLIRAVALSKTYHRGGADWGKKQVIAAATEVSFEIPAGQTLALVGSSGSGKSTVARCVARLERPDAGQIWLDGDEIAQMDSRELRRVRSKCQMVFQDASTSMNPRFTAAEVIEEPLLIQNLADKSTRRTMATQLMREVGLSAEWADRNTMDFSGGQRQRLAIARALALKPKLLILDEALSGLDLSTEAQIANLLLDLQAQRGLAYLLISHDLALVERLAGTIAVMADGRIVEQGPTRRITADAARAETRKLLTAVQSAQANLAAAMGIVR